MKTRLGGLGGGLVGGLVAALSISGCAANPSTGSIGPTRVPHAAIDAIGQRAVAERGIVGLSIAIAQDGEIVYARGFGHADAAHTRPATERTVYDIASVGKQFTAAAIVQLVERGDLAYDTRVRTLVPELPSNVPDATIEQWLRHTSGFVGGDIDELAPPEHYTTPKKGLELLDDVAITDGRTMFAPEETWVYCNAGYLVLGLVVEAAGGMPYDEYIRQHVLAPLDPHAMTVCAYPPADIASERLRRSDEGVRHVPHIDMSAYAGQGSICSSAIDLIRWSRAINDGRIFSHESLARFRTPSTVRGDHATASIPYGFAQRLGVMDGHFKAGHSGTFDGGSASLFTYPDDGLEIAVLSNTMGGGAPHAVLIEAEIAKLLLGVVPPDVESERVPVTEAQKRAIEGTYTDGTRFTATIEGDELVVYQNGEFEERLVHVGNMRFRRADRPDVFEWFVMDGEKAGWWIYSMSGNFLDVLRREDADPPNPH